MLKSDSLAFALHTAASAVAEVMAGRNLTEALTRCWRDHPKLEGAARGAIQDLAYNALRQFGRGDFLLARLMEKPLRDGAAQALLLCALARLEVRPEEAHTIVDQAVAASAEVANGKYKSLTNGVLRNFLRQRAALLTEAEADDVARYRHPRWWIAHLKRAYPRDWRAVLEMGNTHPPMTLRVNRRRISVENYLAQLDAAGIAARPLEGGALLLARPMPVERLPGFGEGLCSVQDGGAQRAAVLLGVADGMRALDACAAPGGKTAHMLELADVDMLALDADAARAARVSENLARLGLEARVQTADCRHLDAWWDGREFDRILADVPCSASGVVRRHPDIKWLRREPDIAKFARQQVEILDALWRVLAPGGKLLYATCSLFPEENSAQVAAFAARHEDCLRLELAGAPELQLLPTPEHDGFYYVLLQKLD